MPRSLRLSSLFLAGRFKKPRSLTESLAQANRAWLLSRGAGLDASYVEAVQ